MALTYTGTGGFATRLGKLFQALESCNVYTGTAAISSASPDLDSLGTSFTEIIAQFASNEQEVVRGLFDLIEGARGSLSGLKQGLVALCKQTLIEQVQRSNILTEESEDAALLNLLEDMVGAGTLYAPDDDVNAHVWSVPATASADTTSHYGAGNTGDGVIRIDDTLVDGRTAELLYAETIRFTCTQDGQEGGGGTARQEQFEFKGEQAIQDKLSHEWPGGSGASGTLQVADAAAEESETLNILHNSDFEEFTSNVPDNWTVITGTAGTMFGKEVTNVYRSSTGALYITGNAGDDASIYQAFDSATGSSYAIKPNTVYALNVFAKDSGAGLLGGVVTFQLTDGTNTVIADDAGTNNAITVAFDDTGTSFAAFGGFFRTPSALPTDGVRLNIKETTSLTTGESMYFDDLCIVEATELYQMGVYGAVFAGATDFVVGDRFTLAVSETSAGEFQEWFNRVFDMQAKRLQLPSDASAGETIADSLIG